MIKKNKIYIIFIGALIMSVIHSCIPDVSNHLQTIRYSKKEVKTEKLNRRKWGKCRTKMLINNGEYASYDKIHQEELTYDFFKPNGKENDILPLVIFIHSGGFVLGDKRNYIISQYCKDIVRTGEFAAASINYRLIGHKKWDDWENTKALYSKGYTRHLLMQALGDVRAAIKYFIDNNMKLKIDPSKIYIVGFSAGAILADQLIFTDYEEANTYILAWLTDQIINKTIKTDDYKIDNSFTFKYNFSENIKGIVAIGGGVLDQKMISDDMDNVNTPMLLIHGTHDGMVPFGNDNPFKRYSRNDIKMPITNFYFDIGVKSKNDGKMQEDNVNEANKIYHISVEAGDEIKKESIEFFIDLFTSPICGSGCMHDKVFKDSEFQLLEIKGAPHVFMLSENGLFNKTYIRTRQEIYRFLNNHLK